MRTYHMVMTGMVIVGLALSGCSEDPDVLPVATNSDTSSVANTGASREVTRDFGGNAYTIAVESIVSDGTILELALRGRLNVKNSEDIVRDFNSLWGQLTEGFGPNQLRLVDFKNSEVLPVGKGEDSCAVSRAPTWLKGPVADEAEIVAYFAAPQSDRVSLMMPSLGMIDDLEVTKASGAYSPPDGIAALSSYHFDRAAMQTLEVPHDSEAEVRVSEETVSIAIPSDILFDFGAAQLTESAAASIGSVEQSIRKYSAGGKLTVVGHTDDQGSDSINDPLSSDRAHAVAGVLTGILGGEYLVETRGAGSREPVVADTSEDARTTNRRVEIVFEYKTQAESADHTADFPTAPDQVGAGDNPFTISDGLGDPYELQMKSVMRRDGVLIANLCITVLGSRESSVMTAFKPKLMRGGRGHDIGGAVTGAANFSMLTSAARFYPIDYQTPSREGDDPNWRALVDRTLVSSVSPNTSVTVTAVWPDPGTDHVTVEVEGYWRITDVPVVDYSAKN